MNRIEDTTIEAVLEHLIADGASGIGPAFTRMFELAMRLERERYLGAGHYERSGDRRGYANGYKPKRLDTPGGTLMVQVPKTAGHEDEPFYLQSLERGQRSVRAVMLAVAEMYIKGVSTREVEAILRQFGIEGLSSTQGSRAAKQLDVELEQWRNRPLGEVRYLILDALYERMRHDGIVRDVAVLSAIGVGPDEQRRVLGVSIALSEAEVTGAPSSTASSPVVCAASSSSSRTITRACALPAGPCLVPPNGSAASSILRKMPSIMRRTPRSGEGSAANCGLSGTNQRWPKRRWRWPNWAPVIKCQRQNSPPGWSRTCPKASPSSACQRPTKSACARQTRSSDPSNRR